MAIHLNKRFVIEGDVFITAKSEGSFKGLYRELEASGPENAAPKWGNQELSGKKQASDTQSANVSSCQREGRYHAYARFE
jgi:hypothetical protein